MAQPLLPSQIQNVKELQRLITTGAVKRLRISKISKIPYTGKVYDIQVSNTNSYQLDNIISSNSAGGSLVNFLLGISTIDPMLWGLSADRFLADSRGGYMLKVTMPEEKANAK